MRHGIEGPAMDRLEWLLDGLAGQAGWGQHDVAEVLAPIFTAQVPTDVFMARMQFRALAYAPLTILALEARGNTARAHIRRHADSAGGSATDSTPSSTIDVVTCTVEPDAPHRIVSTHTIGLVPEHMTPRLPADFSNYPLPRASGARLIVFSGLPGVGKSTLADAVGSRLGIPVFATDWLLGALTPFGGHHLNDLLGIAGELLTTLALRQFALGQSAIIDHPSEHVADRERWRTLAHRVDAEFIPALCECSDPIVHRARLEWRTRGIPGWHDAGAWPNVERRKASFPPWPDSTLTIDTTAPQEENLATLLEHLTT
jgi:predicted kinase